MLGSNHYWLRTIFRKLGSFIYIEERYMAPPSDPSNNQIRFDLRLQSNNGKDVHREFKGSLFQTDGTIAIAEIKPLR